MTDYEAGDKIKVRTGTETWIIEVERREDPIKKGRPGWEGEVVEVVRQEFPNASGTEVGDLKWGYDHQIQRVM